MTQFTVFGCKAVELLIACQQDLNLSVVWGASQESVSAVKDFVTDPLLTKDCGN